MILLCFSFIRCYFIVSCKDKVVWIDFDHFTLLIIAFDLAGIIRYRYTLAFDVWIGNWDRR